MLSLPGIESLERVALFGIGPAAVAVELLHAYLLPLAAVPVEIVQEGCWPGWLRGENTLVICIQTGDSDDAHLLAERALEQGCWVVTTGPAKSTLASALQLTLWPPMPAGPFAISYHFGLLLAACHRLGLLSGAPEELRAAVDALQAQQAALGPSVPVARNPAKRTAGQLVGRWVVVLGVGLFAPAARRWKAQINGLAKALAQCEELPGAGQAGIAGLNFPEPLLSQVIALFLLAPSLPERSRMRLEYTRQIYKMQGINTDSIEARGEGRLAHLWTLLQFGEYMAYYLALAYGENPAPAEVLAEMEQELCHFFAFEG